MNGPEDLVLATRLDVLEKSFEQVESIVTSLQGRRQDIWDLQSLLDDSGSIWDAAFVLRRNIDLSKANLDQVRPTVHDRHQEKFEDTLRALDEAGEAVKTIIESLNVANLAINSMLNRSIIIEEDTDVAKTLSDVLAEEAERSIGDLKGIRATLRKAKETETQTKAEGLMRKAWEDYTKTVYASSPRLFAEYVDLLGGLALRDTGSGFDKDIYSLSDELLRKWASAVKIDWGSLTIPAYQESLDMTPARIVRLGFPEWTLWALPLTAHDFGHVVISQSKDEELKKCIAAFKLGKRAKRYRQVYAADAIATYAMGPAYACAAILLRLNPLLAYKEQPNQPAHAKRAHVIFTILGRMNEDDGDWPYDQIIGLLRDQWSAALDQARPPGRLPDSEIPEELDKWLDRLWEYLEKRRTTIKYSGQNWKENEDWPGKLLKNQVQQISVNGSEEIRDVLNAAWQCRVADQTNIDEISDAAWDLWELIAEKQAKPEPSESQGLGTTATAATSGRSR